MKTKNLTCVAALVSLVSLPLLASDLSLDEVPCACDTEYKVGDLGPGGGFVFKVSDGGTHGIEAVQSLRNPDGSLIKVEWGCLNDNTIAGSRDLGQGFKNTHNILKAECKTVDGGKTAVELAVNFSQNGFTDWFLPSGNELLTFREKWDVRPKDAKEYGCIWGSSASEGYHTTIALMDEWGYYTIWWERSKKCAVRPTRYF